MQMKASVGTKEVKFSICATEASTKEVKFNLLFVGLECYVFALLYHPRAGTKK